LWNDLWLRGGADDAIGGGGGCGVCAERYITKFMGRGVLEAQGASGRIDLPVTLQTMTINSLFSDSAAGASANNGTLFTLLNDPIPSDNSILITNPLSGAPTAQILNGRLDDIAYSNGQLYGVVHSNNQLQIDSIATNGAMQTTLSQSTSNDSNNWRLSGVVNGNALLAVRADSSSSTQGNVINLSTLGVSLITVPAGPFFSDTVINSMGSALTSISPFGQNVASFPGGVAQGTRSSSTQYGSSFGSRAVSDEFTYNYSPSLPAAVQNSWNASVPILAGTVDGLTRLPQVVTIGGPIVISNYITPDGTTVSNVSAINSITQGFSGGSQATPFSISVQNSPTGDLSDRTIGQATATLNLATAHRGIYQLSIASAITGDYSYGSTVDHGRAIQASNVGAVANIAYDPISSNLVGNGDASLGPAGWEGSEVGTGFISELVSPDPSNKSFLVEPQPNFPAAIRQTLQLPTPNTPMLLSFSYFLFPTGVSGLDDIQVSLNGIQLGDVTTSSNSVQTFQTLVSNPLLENLNNASLMFNTETNLNASYVEIGNISLTGVPEPASGGLLIAFAAAALCHRRTRGAQKTRD
jgi:hypothetical protein